MRGRMKVNLKPIICDLGLVGAVLGLYRGCLELVWNLSGNCLELVWMVCGRFVDGTIHFMDPEFFWTKTFSV